MKVSIPKNHKVHIANSKDVFLIMRQILIRENKLGKAQEHFWTIGLNNKNKILYIELMALGKHNIAIISAKRVFKMAIYKDADKIIAVHNHPSGLLQPSDEDKYITEVLKHGGNFIEIKLVDHIIISEKGYFSFKDKQMLK